MEKPVKPKIMLMSLGGSPEPLRKSIEKYTPEQIVFLASHDSVALSGELFKTLDYRPEVRYEITEDPNLMYECYKKARQCVDRVRKSGFSSEEVMVDYTGGTKVMTAALILAAVSNSYRFNYVGGSRRNKDNVGIVIDGHEKMFAEMSPWSIFAEEERRQVVILFNHRRYSAVIKIIDNALERELPIQIRDYFRFIRPLSEGFLKWDQFKHKVALKHLDVGLTRLADYLSAYPDNALESFSTQAKKCKDFIEKVITSTDGLKEFDMVLIDDLLNNARRKIADKRYDDASARIYRALELYGQIIFQKTAGCSNGKVEPKIIPEKLKEEFIRKFRDPHSGYLKLPLNATFEYLKTMGHDAGVRFFERKKEIKNIQSNRNDSILAHGIKHVSEKAINSIFKTVSDFVQATYFFDFPELP